MTHAWRINKGNGSYESFTTLRRTAERMKELQAEGVTQASFARLYKDSYIVEHYTAQTLDGAKWWYAVDSAKVVAALG